MIVKTRNGLFSNAGYGGGVFNLNTAFGSVDTAPQSQVVKTRNGLFANAGYGGGVFNLNTAFGKYEAAPNNVSGLGNVQQKGKMMRQHQYRDVSNLNAPYDDMSLQGVGGLGILGGGDSLGFNMEDEHNIPWLGEESHPTVLAAQQEINKELKADNYGPVLADGILGPRTCGALEMYGKGDLVYNACDDHVSKGFIEPQKAEWRPPMKTPEQIQAEQAAAQQSSTLARSGGSGMPSWVWGILVGGAAIGVAIYIKKKKGR